MEPKIFDNKPFFCFYLPVNDKTSSLVGKIIKLIEKETTKCEELNTNENIKCEFCEKTFKKVNGLTSHIKYCDKKPEDDDEEDEE